MNATLALPTALVDLDELTLHRDSTDFRLTPQEAALLRYLAERNETVTREELLQDVWGYAPQVYSRAVDATVSRLRNKLEPDPKAPRSLISVRGRGYRLVSAEPPTETTHLLGRYVERTRLQLALREYGGAQLTGRGGVGKTALARDLASHRDQLFVELAAIETAEDAVTAIALALGLDVDRPTSLLDRVVMALSGRDEVLVLDNVEQIDGLKETVDTLHGAGISLVVTSRKPVSTSLPVVEVGPIGGEAARELLGRAARRMRPDWSATTEELGAVIELADGLPLALEVLGAQLPLVDPPTLLKDVRRVLTLGDGREGRHATLDTSIRWSWDHMEESDRRHLCFWSCFAGPLRPDALERVSGPGALEALQRLARAGWVDTRAKPPRLFTSVRAFCAGRLRERGEEAEAHLAHASWLSEAMPFDPDRWVDEHGKSYRALATDLGPDLLLALERIQHPERVVELGLALLVQGPKLATARARAVAEQVEAAARASADATLELESLVAHGILARRGRRSDIDAARHRRMLELLHPGLPAGLLARAHVVHGHHLKALGDLDGAVDTYRTGRIHAETAGLPRLVAALDHDLGAVRRRQGRLGEAFDLLMASAAGARSLDDQDMSCLAYQALSSIERVRGSTIRACTFGERAVAAGRGSGNVHVLGGALTNLANVHYSDGDLQSAASMYREAVELLREGGFLRTLCTAIGNLGVVTLQLGDPVEGELLLTEALQLARQVGVPHAAAVWQSYLASLRHEVGATADVLERYRDALASLQAQQAHPQWEHTRCYHAVALAELGHEEEALQALGDAESLAGGGPVDRAILLLARAAVARIRGTRVSDPLDGHEQDEAWASAHPELHTSWLLWRRSGAR